MVNNFFNFINRTISLKDSLEMTPFPVLLVKNGYFLYANSLALQLLEAEHVDELIGKNVYELTHERSYAETRKHLEGLEQKKRDEAFIPNIVTFKQNMLEITSLAVRITLFDEELDYMVIKDSREIIEIEQKYLIQKKDYQALIDNSIDTVAIISAPDHQFTYINKSGVQLLGGKSRKDIIGRTVFDFMHPQHHEEIKARTQHVIEQRVISEVREREIIRLDGDIRYIESIVMPFYVDKNPSLQVIFRDVTEQKQNLKHVIQTEKLSTAGQLSAGIAHEIRNPLTSIKGFLQLIEGEIPPHSLLYTGIMKDEIDKIERITGEMLSLSKPQAYQCQEYNLLNLINDVITLLTPQATLKNVEILTDFTMEQALFTCDKMQIKQVFINIIKNAIEAMERGGKVLITTENKVNWLNIHVIDEGSGISDQHLYKVNEPFFTTKGTGTGLGLTICNAIIKDYNGRILIDSKEQKGTRVTIQLPI
jgi:two-component system sporulation sensor kinase A